MWCIWECAGTICACLTYIIVLTVSIGMVRVGVWEGLLKGERWAFINLMVFQYHTTMIFWSHFKCMTSEPGVLPKNYDSLSISKIASGMSNAILGVRKEIKKLEASDDQKNREVAAIDARIS